MKNIDYKLFLTVLWLIIFWVITISSVSVFSSYLVTTKMVNSWKIKEAYNYFYLVRSISYIVISLVTIWICSKIHFKFFEKYSKIFLGISTLLLIYVLLKWEQYNWATWWISIPGLPMLIQPTEFLKISLIVFLWALFAQYNNLLKSFKSWFLPFLGILSVVVILVWLQPDFWTLMVLLPITVIMFFYAWANKKHILWFWAIWIILFLIVYSLWEYDKTTQEKTNTLWYITQRVDSFFKSNEELFTEKLEKTHQTRQWLITIWSWGFSGKWFWQSIQKFWYLPEVQWDFIFAVIIEELWFRWGFLLILAYLYLGYRWFYISYNVRDPFAKYTSLWITSLILFQAFINIWVNLNIVPLTWVTLPFVSYGGSSLLASSIWIWILLSISREIEEKPKYARMAKSRFIF